MPWVKKAAEYRDRLYPGTKLGRITLWSGGLSLLLFFLSLNGWAEFFAVVFTFGVLWFSFGWAWRHVMWRLRHRLIVTYIFIGVIPIALLLAMAGIVGYLFAGQFAAYIVTSDLQATLRHLDAANEGLAKQLSVLERSGKLNEQTAGQLTSVSDQSFPQRTVAVWRGGKGFLLSTGGALLGSPPGKVRDFIEERFSGLVLDDDGLHLRAVKREEGGFTVISDVPITPELLQPATSLLGSVTLISLSGGSRVNAGNVPVPVNRFDRAMIYYTLFSAIDWETGKTRTGEIGVVTRPSMLYGALFATLGSRAVLLRRALLGIVIFFGLIEIVALAIGVRLSRGMTLSVAELYRATEHVEGGDLTHRIRIRGRDQMAVLGQSFNSMTESLAKLLAEQKEKQRLENELAIGHEVQGSLFPQNFRGLPSLEVYGVCRPARSVSGDYYDFISLGADRLVLAVGDISGKGISAALLMASVHAFVRAYSLEPLRASSAGAPAGSSMGSAQLGDPAMYYRGDGSTQSQLAPGTLMATLNYQLFRSTPPEKYATMFLGCYDGAARELKYCNAGHLPPIILREDGSVCRLETSGTVVGLFDRAAYEESTIAMQTGDIFLAFSDGVTEPERESVEFGEERLIELIRKLQRRPLAEIGDAITGSVADWIGVAEQPDDVTVVLARALAPPELS
jgi:phosphoserine phosphatase RsbU/P